MLAKDIAATLDETWNETNNNTLYPSFNKKIRVAVEEYQPNYVGVFIPENEHSTVSDINLLKILISLLVEKCVLLKKCNL